MDIRLLIALVGVGGVVAGASLTALVSLFTGWLTRRHENRRWLLDKRLESYSAFNEAAEAFNMLFMAEMPPVKQAKAYRVLTTLQRQSFQATMVAPEATAEYIQAVLELAVLLAAAKFAEETKDVREGEALDARELHLQLNEAEGRLGDLQRHDLQGLPLARSRHSMAKFLETIPKI